MIAYHRPESLSEALAIRSSGPTEILAGGTDVYPAKATRAGWGALAHPALLDISGITNLRGITSADEGWRIGCLTTWTDLIRADLPPLFRGLREAARTVGGVQIQNRGTLVGNLCTASPAGDGIPNLLAIGAEVEIVGPAGTRRVSVESFLTGYRSHACGPDEIVTALVIPRVQGEARGAFRKLGARRYLVISIVMAAGVLEVDALGRIVRARIAIGACSAVARRLPELERRLAGLSVAEAASAVEPGDVAGLSPLDDVRASADYRRDAALTLTRDLLGALAVPAERDEVAA